MKTYTHKNNNQNNIGLNKDKEDNISQNNIEFQNNNINNNLNDGSSNNYMSGMTHFEADTPKTEKISQYSSTQSLSNVLSQENVKNNCLKLIQFYSLLNLKLNRISKKNTEIKKKIKYN